jgi:hypothetical protein
MKTILLVSVVSLGLLQSAGAYSLGGPIGNNPKPNGGAIVEGDAWQQPVIGYGLGGDEVAPKNLGEEYRRNLPVMYYSCDANFLDYFGANGKQAIDQAFVILNAAFTNNPTGTSHGLDGYSANLVEFPLETRHFNYQAQAMGLWDMKSITLGAMMEQMSLADPVRYVWTLHDRLHASGTGIPPCPGGMEYLVVQRSFDYVSSPLNQLQASPYINDTLYSYQIFEACTGPNPLALAEPYSVDPLADTYSPVACMAIASYGAFYSGLTRDDVAGLRYMLSTNNINTESPDASSLLFTITTNFTEALLPATNVVTSTNGLIYYFDGTVGYGNYGWLVAQSVTNSPAALQALYPGIIITSSTNYYVLATNWVYTQYYTNTVGSQYPTPPTLVTVSNAQVYLLEKFVNTFGNVITNWFANQVSPKTVSKQQIISVQPAVGAQYPAPPVTNITTRTIIENTPSGYFFVFTPFYTNYCLPDIVRVGLTNVVAITNTLTGASTNITTITNTSVYYSTLIQIDYFTNYTFIINPVTCTNGPAPPALYQGIEKIQFVYAPFDSFFGQTYTPITNNYSLVEVADSQAVAQKFQRIVTQPDFDFTAYDLVSGPSTSPNPQEGAFDRNVNFDQANAYSGLAGPGTVTVPTTIGFNKAGPVYYNGTLGANDVMDGTPFFTETPGGDISNDNYYSFYDVLGSFDGTTNAPVIYANGMSIQDLADQVLIQVTTTPAGPLSGSVGMPVSVRFSPSGGAFEMPYSWSATGLPSGTTIVSNSDNTATLTGTPTAPGNYSFTLVLMDSLGRSVQWTYNISIQ